MLKRLSALQAELKAPKGQYNKFGNYSYRSCEDILEAVKPLLVKHNLTLTVSDSIEQIGERFYVKASAIIRDPDSDKMVTATAYAREPLDVKGMSDSQITGAASSYARKYALNGLFLIDDTKDADSNETRVESDARAKKQTVKKPMNFSDVLVIFMPNGPRERKNIFSIINTIIIGLYLL